MNDTDLMEFGKYIGWMLIDLPNDYIKYLYTNNVGHSALRIWVEERYKFLFEDKL